MWISRRASPSRPEERDDLAQRVAPGLAATYTGAVTDERDETGVRDNVIHVVFGREGRRSDLAPQSARGARGAEDPSPELPSQQPTRRVDPPPLPTDKNARPSVSPVAVREPGDDPLSALYSTSEVARLFALTPSRLRYWDRTGFVCPSGRFAGRRYYTFQDLIGLRVTKGLLDRGIPVRNVRRSMDALRGSLPRVTRPLAELRVVADGQTVVVRDDAVAYEPLTGQLVLDFDVKELRDDVVRELHPAGQRTAHRQRAYELYLEGCRLDEDETTLARAEECYRQSLELDPSLSNAFTNLGNLRFRRGAIEDAEGLYRKALSVDEAQPEALYNLGFLCFERGDPAAAAELFVRALASDPSFADAHFNLAMAYEELGRPDSARGHWRTYLKLDPSGPWAEIARRHLSC